MIKKQKRPKPLYNKAINSKKKIKKVNDKIKKKIERLAMIST
jgi:hypothetical protein